MTIGGCEGKVKIEQMDYANAKTQGAKMEK
jgi:hypothetical protein